MAINWARKYWIAPCFQGWFGGIQLIMIRYYRDWHWHSLVSFQSLKPSGVWGSIVWAINMQLHAITIVSSRAWTTHIGDSAMHSSVIQKKNKRRGIYSESHETASCLPGFYLWLLPSVPFSSHVRARKQDKYGKSQPRHTVQACCFGSLAITRRVSHIDAMIWAQRQKFAALQQASRCRFCFGHFISPQLRPKGFCPAMRCQDRTDVSTTCIAQRTKHNTFFGQVFQQSLQSWK